MKILKTSVFSSWFLDALKVGIFARDIEAIPYGSIIPAILNFKENIFGYWDEYTSFSSDLISNPGSKAIQIDEMEEVISNVPGSTPGWEAPFRPFSVIVDVQVQKVTARLPLPPNLTLVNGGPIVMLVQGWQKPWTQFYEKNGNFESPFN